MGEGIKVVSIQGTSYIIKTGHNNNDRKAIEIALEEREKQLNKDIEFYQKNQIKDENGNLMSSHIDFDIQEIFVSDGVEIN